MGKTLIIGGLVGFGAYLVYKKMNNQGAATIKGAVIDRGKVQSIIPRLIYTTKGQQLELTEKPNGTIVDTYGNVWI